MPSDASSEAGVVVKDYHASSWDAGTVRCQGKVSLDDLAGLCLRVKWSGEPTHRIQGLLCTHKRLSGGCVGVAWWYTATFHPRTWEAEAGGSL